MIRRIYDRPEPRLADLDALAGLAGDYPGLDNFLADLTLDPPSSTGDLAGKPSLDDDWLTLSTVHSAKGGEWDVVHLIHAADGAFPSDMATGTAEGVDEERRLFYVALTRARSHLHIYAPLRYHHGDPGGWTDEHSYAQRTRFLPPELDRSHGHAGGSQPGRLPHARRIHAGRQHSRRRSQWALVVAGTRRKEIIAFQADWPLRTFAPLRPTEVEK